MTEEEEVTKLKAWERGRALSLGPSASQVCPDHLLGTCALGASCSMDHPEGRPGETKPKAKGKAKAKAKATPKDAVE